MSETVNDVSAKTVNRIRKRDLCHRFCFEAFGVIVGISSNDNDGISQVKAAISRDLPIRVNSVVGKVSPQIEFTLIRNRRQKDTLRRDNQTITSRMDRDRTIEILASQIRIAIAEYADGVVFVHAGVVGWKGSAILIPGNSYSGKSTLTAALVRRGAEYYSDEYAVLNKEGFVYPFPKPISIRDGVDPFRQRDFPIGAIGGTVGITELQVGLVVVTEYVSGADFVPEVLTSGNGILEAIRHTIPIRRNPQFALEALVNVAETATFIKSQRGEAAEAAGKIIAFADSLPKR